MSLQTSELLSKVAQTIYEKKGFNILAIDVKGISSLTDYFLIAEGNVNKHVKAIANDIVSSLKKEGEQPAHVEGLDSSEWIVVDYVNIIIHLFTPEFREKYRIEELWSEGSIVDLNLELETGA